jgi:hypothetical protein
VPCLHCDLIGRKEYEKRRDQRYQVFDLIESFRKRFGSAIGNENTHEDGQRRNNVSQGVYSVGLEREAAGNISQCVLHPHEAEVEHA